MTVKIFHETLEIDTELKDLTQRDLEKYFAELRNLGVDVGDDTISIPEISGNALRAAIKCNLLSGMKSSNVDDMKPAAVLKIQIEVSKAINEALAIPPE